MAACMLLCKAFCKPDAICALPITLSVVGLLWEPTLWATVVLRHAKRQ